MRIAIAVGICLGMALGCMAQTTPTQYITTSVTAASLGGQPVSIMSGGVSLLRQSNGNTVSTVYEFISNPVDPASTHIGSGLANYTACLCSFIPASIKSKLLIDTTNLNLTFQGGAGVASYYNGVNASGVFLPRTRKTVGNFGIFPSWPMPGGHVIASVGYKWIVNGRGGLVRAPAGNLVFTF